MRDPKNTTLKPSFEGARAETEMVLFTCIQQLLDNLKIAPSEVLPPKNMQCISFACVSLNMHLKAGPRHQTRNLQPSIAKQMLSQ